MTLGAAGILFLTLMARGAPGAPAEPAAAVPPRAARRGQRPRHPRLPGRAREEGRQGGRGVLGARHAHGRGARRRRGAPGRAPEERRRGGARVGRGEALGVRPEGRPRAAPRDAAAPLRQPARERRHPLARGDDARSARRRAGDRQPDADEPRGRARRRPPAGAVRVLRRPRSADLPRPARPARHRRLVPRDRPRPRGEVLCGARRHDRRRVADRLPQELELGREEARHPRRQGAGGRAAEGAGRRPARPAHEGDAEAADRGRRPLVHDAAALVDARRLRAGRDRDVRAREPGAWSSDSSRRGA